MIAFLMLSLLCLLSICFNSLLTYILVKNRKQAWARKAAQLFYLVLSDLLCSIILIPRVIFAQLNISQKTYEMCAVLNLTVVTTQIISFYQVLSLCIHRYMVIRKVNFPPGNDKYRYGIESCVIWTVVILLCMPPYYFWGRHGEHLTNCYFANLFGTSDRQALLYLLVLLCIPWVLTNAVYVALVFKMRSTGRVQPTTCTTSQIQSGINSQQTEAHSPAVSVALVTPGQSCTHPVTTTSYWASNFQHSNSINQDAVNMLSVSAKSTLVQYSAKDDQPQPSAIKDQPQHLVLNGQTQTSETRNLPHPSTTKDQTQHTTIKDQPQYSATKDQPRNSDIKDRPQTPASKDQSQTWVIKDQPKHLVLNGQTQTSVTNDQPLSSATNEQPQHSATNDKAKPSAINDRPQASATKDQTQTSTTKDQPQTSTIKDQHDNHSAMIMDKRQPLAIKDQTQHTAIKHQPRNSATKKQPRNWTIKGQPQTPATKDQPQTSVIKIQPVDTATNDKTQTLATKDQPKETKYNQDYSATFDKQYNNICSETKENQPLAVAYTLQKQHFTPQRTTIVTILATENSHEDTASHPSSSTKQPNNTDQQNQANRQVTLASIKQNQCYANQRRTTPPSTTKEYPNLNVYPDESNQLSASVKQPYNATSHQETTIPKVTLSMVKTQEQQSIFVRVRNGRVIKAIAYLLLAFNISILPLLLIPLMELYGGGDADVVPPQLQGLVFLNNIFNPIIYTFAFTHLRDEVTRVLRPVISRLRKILLCQSDNI